jgi:outer membrane lipoprotein-sorting protein
MHISSRLIVALLWLTASGASAMTVDELVAKNIEARGGLERIKALHSLRTTSKMRMGGDGFSLEMASTELFKRGGMYRSESSLQGLTAVEAHDGKEAWQIQPFQGRKDPSRLSADDAKSLARSAEFEGPLVDWKAKGHQLEYLGTEDVDGTEAHVLKVTRKDGDIQYLYLDPDHFLEIRVVVQSRSRGAVSEMETDLGNYEQVAGVYLPFSIETGPKGGRKYQKVTVLSAEPNVALEDAQFRFPVAAPAPKPPEASQPPRTVTQAADR